MQKIKILVGFLIIFSLIMPVCSVKADGAPLPAPGFGGLEPFHYQSTEVRMEYERVEMEVSQAASPNADTPNPVEQVSVTAWFVMRNTGSTDEAMQVAFPLDNLNTCLRPGTMGAASSDVGMEIKKDTFSASVDGTASELKTITTKHPYADKADCMDIGFDWAAFEVNFPVDQVVLIRVSYLMTGLTSTQGRMDVFQYILETGGGWKGTIGRANIIVHFPYMTNEENILDATTPGFQYLYDEIYWSFADLEPTWKDNISVAFITLSNWEEINSLRSRIKQNIHDVTAWFDLSTIYMQIGISGHYLRDQGYRQKCNVILQQAMAANPESPELYAQYANYLFKLNNWLMGKDSPEVKLILNYIAKALALDPENELANWILDYMKKPYPDLVFTPPPTSPSAKTRTPTPIPSNTLTASSIFTPSLSLTHSPTEPWITSTYIPTQTPTPSPTRNPYLPTETFTNTPVPTSIPTPVPPPAQTQSGNTAWLFILVGIVIAAGSFTGGWLYRNRKQQ